jgi:predicted permease
MNIVRRGWSRLMGALRGARGDAELQDEIESHLEMLTEDNLSLGMPPEEARRQAVLKLGGVEFTKESYRDQRGLPRLDTFFGDVRYALRTLRKEQIATLVAVLSLAVGIGATLAIFSVVNALLIRPLPYSEPGQLVSIFFGGRSYGGSICAPAFEVMRHQAHVIERAALFVNYSFNLGGSGEPERVPAARVSADLFSILGIQPVLGRTFVSEEDVAGHDAVVVLGNGIWRRRFGSDPNIVGRKILLTGVPHTVIGVMPPGFRFPDGPEFPWQNTFPPAEIWRPMALADWEQTCIGCLNFAMVARLRPGVSSMDARAEFNAIIKRELTGKNNLSPIVSELMASVTVRTLKEALVGKTRPAVAILFSAVMLALLIACVNVANLLLARGLQRRTEIAIRLAIGAGRGRIVRQLLTEALVVAILAAMLAIPIAVAGVHTLLAIAPSGIPRIDTVSVDGRVLAFALVLSLATVLVFGCAPALANSRKDPGDVMKSGERTITGIRTWMRPGLVVAEFAFCLVLLIASTLLARSFIVVSQVRLGFRPESVLTMRIPFKGPQYDGRIPVMAAQLSRSCAALPGATSAGAITTLPLTDPGEGHGVTSNESPDPNHGVMFRYRAVTPSYFRTVGTRLIRGREFTDDDRGDRAVAIVSETGARALWPGVADPIGRTINEDGRKIPTVLVGIVEDTRASGVDSESVPYLYVPFAQFSSSEFAIVVKTASEPSGIVAAVKREVWRIDPTLPVTHVTTMRQLVADSIAMRRFQAVLMMVFAGFALVLAGIGIYGVVSYSVTSRSHEIGIRMALGASRAGVLVRLMRDGGLLSIVGVILGVAVFFLVAPFLTNLLFGVTAIEPATLIGCAAVLVSVGAVATLIPALRATAVNPMVSLRYE